MPLLSIVVPTRNRSEYAASCVRSLLRIRSPDLEVIIRDNSAMGTLRTLLEPYARDVRLRYFHQAEATSVVDNCNQAVALAKGVYVTLLGDDDGVNPEIIDASIWAEDNGIDALVPFPIAHYTWPDVRFRYYGWKWAGMLTIRDFSGSVIRQDIEAGIHRSAKLGFQNLVNAVDLPKFYYGIIRRGCLEELRRVSGAYFHGVSPDMGAAIGLSGFVRTAVAVDYPLFVPGTSAKSTAGASARKEHVGRLQDQQHLPANCAADWPMLVPAIFTVQTVWAQSAIAALRATRRDAILKDFNLECLHAMCAVFNPGYVRTVVRNYYRALRTVGGSPVVGTIKLLGLAVRMCFRRARNFLTRLGLFVSDTPKWSQAGFTNIDEAVVALSGYIRDSGRRFLTSVPPGRWREPAESP